MCVNIYIYTYILRKYVLSIINLIYVINNLLIFIASFLY